MSTSWKLNYNNGTGWHTAYTIPNPTNELVVTATSTRSINPLYDGSLGRVIPTTKSNFEPTEISWSFISGTNVLITTASTNLSLSAIMGLGYLVRFTTHSIDNASSTQVWEGYLTSYPKTYKLGMYPAASGNHETFYDLSVSFDLISVT